jgi:hypothetical protein
MDTCDRCGWELADWEKDLCGPCETTVEVMELLGEEQDY